VKHVDEYRNADEARALAGEIARTVTRPWTIMEVCGGQTHAIVRFGIDQLLPADVELVHGPGCPVCVTPVALIDAACRLAERPEVVLCSFGDMLRVPGSDASLQDVKTRGGDVRVVYSPLDAVAIAEREPQREIVFFAVGFETTAPANALAIQTAARRELGNFSALVSHVLVPPAIEAVLGADDNRVEGFLAAGHVCTVMGCAQYHPLADRYRAPIVVTGFEPCDILHGLLLCLRQLERGEARVEISYARSVRTEGNASAQNMVDAVFAIGDRDWRGVGSIPDSGLHLRPTYARFDACRRFALAPRGKESGNGCISGEILRGVRKPPQCPHFGRGCTPERPMGATMVSEEGACAAYYRYRPPVETTP